MDRYRNVEQEQLECHLYGQLISILLCSSTMFKMRKLLLRKKQKELIDNANLITDKGRRMLIIFLPLSINNT